MIITYIIIYDDRLVNTHEVTALGTCVRFII